MNGLNQININQMDIDDKTGTLLLEAAFALEKLEVVKFLKSKKIGRLFIKKLNELGKANPK